MAVNPVIVDVSSDSDISADGIDRRPKSPSPELFDGPRPWLQWGSQLRHQFELISTFQTSFPIGDSWVATDKYIERRDEQMLHYMEDFPLSNWLVGKEAALAAYRALCDRCNLRQKGKSIFTNGRPFWWPLGPGTLPDPREPSPRPWTRVVPSLLPPPQAAPLARPHPLSNHVVQQHLSMMQQPSHRLRGSATQSKTGASASVPNARPPVPPFNDPATSLFVERGPSSITRVTRSTRPTDVTGSQPSMSAVDAVIAERSHAFKAARRTSEPQASPAIAKPRSSRNNLSLIHI